MLVAFHRNRNSDPAAKPDDPPPLARDRPPPEDGAIDSISIAVASETAAEDDPPEAAIPEDVPPRRLASAAGSLAIHLAVLAIIALLSLHLPEPPAEAAPPIQLTLVPADEAATLPPIPAAPPAPPRSALASEDRGDVRPPAPDPAGSMGPLFVESDRSEPPKAGAARPLPPSPNGLALGNPLPPQPSEGNAAKPPPAGPKTRTDQRVALAQQPRLERGRGAGAQISGAPASRDEYLVYVRTILVQAMQAALPPLAGNRKIVAQLGIDVLVQGTIASARIETSSGYSDIDRKLEALVRGVGRLPPVPQWYQGAVLHLTFDLNYPDALL